MPPLRERGDDVLLLAEPYVETFNQRLRLRKEIRKLSPEVAAAFSRYRWPVNVRELRNVSERAMIIEDEDVITVKYLPRDIAAGAVRQSSESSHPGLMPSGFTLPPEGLSFDDIEMSLVRQALAQSGGNQTCAGELLGIARDQLRYRLKKL